MVHYKHTLHVCSYSEEPKMETSYTITSNTHPLARMIRDNQKSLPYVQCIHVVYQYK